MDNWLKIHMLMRTRRYDQAEAELRRMLAADPDDADAHRLLSFALANQQKQGLALAEAQEAVRLNPEDDENYYCLGLAQYQSDQFKPAEASARRALELDPDDPDNWSLLSNILMVRNRYREALAAADSGLAVNAEHHGCASVRVRALAALGQHDEASVSAGEALRANPEDDVAHCNLGWTLLRQGKADQAAVHFREALRIDPEYEYAREGLIEALRARHRLYGLFLRSVLWTERLPGWTSWALLAGFIISRRVLNSFATDWPYLAVASFALLAVWLLFWIWYWAATPLFTLTLRLSRENRSVLSADQIAASNWHAVVLTGILLLLLGRSVIGNYSGVLGAFLLSAMLPAITVVYDSPAGFVRRWMGRYVAALAVIGIFGLLVRTAPGLLLAMYILGPLVALTLFASSWIILCVFLLGLLAIGWVSRQLHSIQRRRELRGYALQPD